jgi:hypothetical protein
MNRAQRKGMLIILCINFFALLVCIGLAIWLNSAKWGESIIIFSLGMVASGIALLIGEQW